MHVEPYVYFISKSELSVEMGARLAESKAKGRVMKCGSLSMTWETLIFRSYSPNH